MIPVSSLHRWWIYRAFLSSAVQLQRDRASQKMDSLAFPEVSLVTVLTAVATIGAAALAAVIAKLVSELRRPPPSGGTPYVLPNGMRIQHWQKGETDFLFEEIWGKGELKRFKCSVICY